MRVYARAGFPNDVDIIGDADTNFDLGAISCDNGYTQSCNLYWDNDTSIWDCDGFCGPSDEPTQNPTVSPVDDPSISPSAIPWDFPSNSPANLPTNYPNDAPSSNPLDSPSNSPIRYPTFSPTVPPHNLPSFSPTHIPSNSPNNAPTSSPTTMPQNFPTDAPSGSPISIVGTVPVYLEVKGVDLDSVVVGDIIAIFENEISNENVEITANSSTLSTITLDIVVYSDNSLDTSLLDTVRSVIDSDSLKEKLNDYVGDNVEIEINKDILLSESDSEDANTGGSEEAKDSNNSRSGKSDDSVVTYIIVSAVSAAFILLIGLFLWQREKNKKSQIQMKKMVSISQLSGTNPNIGSLAMVTTKATNEQQEQPGNGEHEESEGKEEEEEEDLCRVVATTKGLTEGEKNSETKGIGVISGTPGI